MIAYLSTFVYNLNSCVVLDIKFVYLNSYGALSLSLSLFLPPSLSLLPSLSLSLSLPFLPLSLSLSPSSLILSLSPFLHLSPPPSPLSHCFSAVLLSIFVQETYRINSRRYISDSVIYIRKKYYANDEHKNYAV